MWFIIVMFCILHTHPFNVLVLSKVLNITTWQYIYCIKYYSDFFIYKAALHAFIIKSGILFETEVLLESNKQVTVIC